MHLVIDLKQQVLLLFMSGQQPVATYPISSGKNGIGQQMGSEKTPLGKHRICETIGANLPINAVLVGRRWTQEIYTPALGAAQPGRDWILTRILWLAGLEPGFNQGGEVDTKMRYIYIHGSPDATPMGVPGSRGCIRLHNRDLLALFEQVSVDTVVEIVC